MKSTPQNQNIGLDPVRRKTAEEENGNGAGFVSNSYRAEYLMGSLLKYRHGD